MPVPAIIAALPREVAGLVRGIQPDPIARRLGIYTYILPHCVVACAGMGPTRATLAVEAALRLADIHTLISAGLAGGCHPLIKVSSISEARLVVDSLTGERFQAGEGTGGTLVTTHTIASVMEKRRLFSAYGADVVDMEAASVGRLAAMHGLKFRAIKAVSDGHDFELSSLARFSSPHGHFRTGGVCFAYGAAAAAVAQDGATWFGQPAGAGCFNFDYKGVMTMVVAETMKAAVYRGVDDVRFETMPVPEIGPGEVLVRIGHMRGLWDGPEEDPHQLASRAEGPSGMRWPGRWRPLVLMSKGLASVTA